MRLTLFCILWQLYGYARPYIRYTFTNPCTFSTASCVWWIESGKAATMEGISYMYNLKRRMDGGRRRKDDEVDGGGAARGLGRIRAPSRTTSTGATTYHLKMHKTFLVFNWVLRPRVPTSWSLCKSQFSPSLPRSCGKMRKPMAYRALLDIHSWPRSTCIRNPVPASKEQNGFPPYFCKRRLKTIRMRLQ